MRSWARLRVKRRAHGWIRTPGRTALRMAARVVLGVGEAGHFPSVVRASSEWFPQKERAYAIGWVNSATTIGVILTAPTLWLCMEVLGWGWRETFIYTGLFGVILATIWWWVYSAPRQSGKTTTTRLLAELPPRKSPPKQDPPLRRIARR